MLLAAEKNEQIPFLDAFPSENGQIYVLIGDDGTAVDLAIIGLLLARKFFLFFCSLLENSSITLI